VLELQSLERQSMLGCTIPAMMMNYKKAETKIHEKRNSPFNITLAF
jgi:hypothetical protein